MWDIIAIAVAWQRFTTESVPFAFQGVRASREPHNRGTRLETEALEELRAIAGRKICSWIPSRRSHTNATGLPSIVIHRRPFCSREPARMWSVRQGCGPSPSAFRPRGAGPAERGASPALAG